jgi:hypothetical protein
MVKATYRLEMTLRGESFAAHPGALAGIHIAKILAYA